MTRSSLPFTASSVGRVGGGGGAAALVMELRPFVVMMSRAAPVAVIDGTDFLEPAAMPLLLRFALLNRVRLTGQRPRDDVKFLPRQKK